MMTAQANDIQWYIARDGKQHGPLTDIEMRTFVAHHYLRLSDLIWRPGMPEWQSAPNVFPTAFEALGQEPKQAAVQAHVPVVQSPTYSQAAVPHDARGIDYEGEAAVRPERNLIKRLVLAGVAITVIGGGAFALTSYRGAIMGMVGGSGDTSADNAPVVAAPSDPSSAATTASTNKTAEPAAAPDATQTASASPSGGAGPTTPTNDVITAGSPPADTTTSSVTAPTSDASSAPPAAQSQVAAVEPESSTPPSPPSVDGSPLDLRLQTVPVWALLKREYPDWYSNEITSANKLVADNKPESDVATLLAQGLVTLRRQNADKALAASSEKLQAIAEAFLNHLKSLRGQSVSACFGFISKGEMSPAVIQMMEHPETATALNAQADAIFEAISEGSKNPVKHDSAVKSDYDILIKELGKLGWKEEDLQVFSNPKLLAKREPEQVCKMVQEWFIAHLAVEDKAVRDRLLYETLKPVVSG
ncbi:MAG TPA: GYF domain-containing protein [Hyphomicrobium sp.]|nr:GYF domain-containing protein [Hyphomicrobium sp.]